jgi:hypothetical protein
MPDSELQALLGRADHHGNSPGMGAMKVNPMTGPKNENASTSPEGHPLIGSGEVGKASLPDPATAQLAQQLSQQHQLQQQLQQSQQQGSLTGARSLAPNTLAAFLGHGQATAKQDMDGGLSQLEKSGKDMKSAVEEALRGKAYLGNYMNFIHNRVEDPGPPAVVSRGRLVSSSSMTDMPDVKPPMGKKGLKHSQSMAMGSINSGPVDSRSLFEKFDCGGLAMPQAQLIGGVPVGLTGSGGDNDDLAAPKVRIKMPQGLRGVAASVGKSQDVIQSPSSAGSKSSNSNAMFDFHSDEEDGDQPAFSHVGSAVNAERLTVYASSPTRLQISSKPKALPLDPSPDTVAGLVLAKPEKYKRSKDKGSGTSKRKKDRDEAKREKKRKKAEHDRYLPTGKETVYHASTIEGDQTCGTKLKIRVSKEPIVTIPSPQTPILKEASVGLGRMDVNPLKAEKFCEKVNDAMKRRNLSTASSASSPCVEKVLLKHELKIESDEESRDSTDFSTHLYRSSSSNKVSKSASMSGKNSLGSSSSNNSALSKSDPKLAKATIRLKPLSLTTTTTSASAIAITATTKPTPSTQSSSSSSSNSSSGVGSTPERAERRNQSSATTPVSTPTTCTTLCMSTYLPDAPTPKSVASLPKIPRVSSSLSSTASISSGTTTTAAITSSKMMGATATGLKNSTVNASFNNTIKTGSPGLNNRTNTSPGAPRMPGAGFNRVPGPGVQRTSSPKTVYSNSAMPPGILKNSGNVSGANVQKTGNQLTGKGAGLGPNQGSGANRTINSAGQTGVVPKSGPSPQGKNTASPSTLGSHKSSGIQGGPPKTISAGNAQRSPSLTQSSSVQRSPSQGSVKVSGSPSQNTGTPKAGLQGKSGGTGTSSGSSATNNQNKNFAQGTSPAHKNTSQGSNSSTFPSKTPGSGGWNSLGQGQKGQNMLGRSASTGSHTANPSSSGGTTITNSSGSKTVSSGTNNIRSSSVSSSASSNPTTGRTPPNHLPINRSISAPGTKAAGSAGSSPRLPSTNSPSNPNAPRFPGSNSQPKASGVSSSSSSQRPASTTVVRSLPIHIVVFS